MTIRFGIRAALTCVALFVAAGCSPSSDPAQQAPPTATAEPPATATVVPSAEPAADPVAESVVPQEEAVADVATPPATATAEVPAAQVAPAAKPAAPAGSSPAPRSISPPATTAKAPVQAPAPAPVQTPVQAPVQAAAVVPEPAPAAAAAPTKSGGDPGGPVAVAATKAGLKRVGAEACADCHDVQFESWSTSKHAARKPPLDCEDCHGPGSEYKANSVMKDPARARAAGLVIPDKTFCSKCHESGVNDAFLKKVHAHE